jgi:hypothetical protein
VRIFTAFFIFCQSIVYGLTSGNPVFLNLDSVRTRWGPDIYLAHFTVIDALNQKLATKDNRRDFGTIVSDFGEVLGRFLSLVFG